MESIHVQFKGQTKDVILPTGVETTWEHLQDALVREFGVPKDAQRVFYNKKRVEFETPELATLRELGWDAGAMRPRIMLMAGASRDQIEEMKKTQEEVQAEQRIRASRRVVSVEQRNQQVEAREAASTDYRFHAIEVLENFSDSHRARSILEQLANDRGILAVMAKHKWGVGCLAEMYPDGKVGVDPVCVLGLNQNKGQKILLRLRTDDLQGFRKFLNIKKVLFHELSHNEHSDHDSKFYQLMRQVEKECDELDWSHHGGRAVGGAGRIAVIPDQDENVGSSGQRLGGGSQNAVSRLLLPDHSPPPLAPANTIVSDHHDHELSSPSVCCPRDHPTHSTTTIEDREHVHNNSSPEAATGSFTPVTSPTDTTPPGPAEHIDAAEQMDVEPPSQKSDSDTNVHGTSTSPPPTYAMATSPTAPLIDESFGDYMPSERELRLQRALEGLRSRYSAQMVTRAASFMHKIVSNIAQHPHEAKFKTIRKSNRLFETRLACYPECLEFLLAIGFDDQGESFTLVRHDVALLWIGRSLLEVFSN